MQKGKNLPEHIYNPFHKWYLTILPLTSLIVGMFFTVSLLKARSDLKAIGMHLRFPKDTSVLAGIIFYKVEEGDTVESIAQRFNISVESIIWANDIPPEQITTNSVIRIPPVTGVIHTVRYGETLESIAQKYGADPQEILNYQYNEFSNDPAFPLTFGQILIIPGGRKTP